MSRLAWAFGAKRHDLLRGGLRWQRERGRSDIATRTRARGRQSVIFVLMALALGSLGLRTAYWQLAQQRALAARADRQHLRAIAINAGRGMILDANGHELALSITEDTVIADPDVIREVNALDTTAATLAQVLGQPADLMRRELNVPGAYVQVRGADGKVVRLSSAASALLSADIERGTLAGVALIPSVRRVYPNGALAAQALGFVRASDGAGQYGVEQQLQATLAGRPGLLYTAVDANGDPLATGPQRQVPAVPGADVTLTLDTNVQYWAEQGLVQAVAKTGADGGTVLAMDPHTGAIIAMASLPAFDPNAYGAASLASFVNPAVSDTYDPGSVLKAVTMAAGIDCGAIAPGSAFYDDGSVLVDGITLHNWDHRAHGEETMTQVLQNSANVGAVWVAQHIGRDRFQSYLASFGFGAPSGVDLPTEAPGVVQSFATPGEGDLEMAESAFGESIAVTPLQMVAAYGALANGGALMRPYLVARVAADGGQGAVTDAEPHPVRQVVDPATAAKVTRMLVDSAYASEAHMDLLSGYAIAAKTGTSTPDPRHPEQTYASVIGYAPASNPRFVLLVKLDHPTETIFGGSAAGPLWRQLAQQLFVYYRIAPDAQAPAASNAP